jgi:hypothetical protein
MKSAIGPKPDSVDAHSTQHVAIYERLFQGLGLFRAGPGVTIGWDKDQYVISAESSIARKSGSFKGEYDQTKSYSAGDTFIISENVTIATIEAVAGYYGVPPAGTDSKGTWAGNVPANPTGNAVPQHPLPTVGADPNDKFYARMIVAYC